MSGRVVRISIAPVKALGLVHPDEVRLEAGGVARDHRLRLGDDDGRLFNNRRCGPLMSIRPSWDERTRRLELTFPDGAVVAGAVELGPPLDVQLHHVDHPSRLVLGPWQQAISAFVGEPVRLLWSESGAADRSAGGGTVSLVSQGSLERLRDQAGASAPVDGRRFRMLFEIDGVEAHAEDGWIGGRVRLGDAEVEVAGDVGRCVITTMDPDRGVRDLDTLGALAGYRREGRSEPLPFGVYATVHAPGLVRLGDPVAAVAPST
jgi:uncharacterized protein